MKLFTFIIIIQSDLIKGDSIYFVLVIDEAKVLGADHKLRSICIAKSSPLRTHIADAHICIELRLYCSYLQNLMKSVLNNYNKKITIDLIFG